MKINNNMNNLLKHTNIIFIGFNNNSNSIRSLSDIDNLLCKNILNIIRLNSH